MDVLRYLIVGAGIALLAQANGPTEPAKVPHPEKPGVAAEPATAAVRAPAADLLMPWYIILNGPDDLAAFWRRIEQPDFMVIKADQRLSGRDVAPGSTRDRAVTPRWVVESVHVRGQVRGDFADLAVDLSIAVKGSDALWVPIRLDRQSLVGAREGAVDRELRQVEPGQWQVKLDGEGEHRIAVSVKAPVNVSPARKSLLIFIPEAASTRVDLDFSKGDLDIVLGKGEVFEQQHHDSGKTIHLAAWLSPRSALELSWATDSENGLPNAPLLTAKSEIAIDIDDEQLRTRSSWAVRCVRGTARSFEIQTDDDDEVTELLLDDQTIEAAAVERLPNSGRRKLRIRLDDPLQAGVIKRLVMNTRRSLARGGSRQLAFTGFPLVSAREQSGFIGITQSANLFVEATASRGLRPIDSGKLPENLRTRPSTSLAFEFLDQPFLLNLKVESAPPLVRAESKTLFRIGSDLARSETRIDLDWVRGQLSELEFSVAPGLQVVSVGPPGIVESSHVSDEAAATPAPRTSATPRRLKVRLSGAGRDPARVSLILVGRQAVPSDGAVNLGVFVPVHTVSVSALYAVLADRGLSVDVDDESGRIKRLASMSLTNGLREGWPWAALRRDEPDSRILDLVDETGSPFLPVRLARHARTITQETTVAAEVGRRSIDLVERVTLAVRFGLLNSLEIRVPAAIGDRWELLDKDIVDREERGRDPDGSTRYRLSFLKPVVDRVTIRLRYRLAVSPALEARTAREIMVPWITATGVPAEPMRVNLSLSPEIVLTELDKNWVVAPDDGESPTAQGETTTTFTRGMAGRGDDGIPFKFKARALDSVALPTFLVPRLLLRTVYDGVKSARTSARYWVEAHGSEFAFALADGAQWIGARIDGRLAEHVDHDPDRDSYRLRLPAELKSKPVLIELEYQLNEASAQSPWQPPRLLEGGVVLQTRWEVRLPPATAVLGVPTGWSDENQWFWSGIMWKRRSWQNAAAINEWISGPDSSGRAAEAIESLSFDDSQRYLFGRSGDPVPLGPWVISRSWLVVVCSGIALLVGFFAIFAQLRFRTVWAAGGAIGVLAAALVEPSAILLILESAAAGIALTLVGLLIESRIVRLRADVRPGRVAVAAGARPGSDSSLRPSAAPIVGSDDSTAVRMRAPSTLDFVATPLIAPEIASEPRDSDWKRG